MISSFGAIFLVYAFLIAVFGAVSAFTGALTGKASFARSAERASHLVFWLVLAASCLFAYALATGDFSIEYVAQYTNTTLPLFYRISAFWAGQTGSLFFWLLVLSCFIAISAFQNRRKNRALMPYAMGVLLAVEVFFLVLLNFVCNPFEALPNPPPDGAGMNPILQHPAMAIHPPILFFGYVGLTVPFAFAMASLFAGRFEGDWLKSIRRWTLVSWLSLTIGIVLGALWAYHELGWGGYWGWDPVENSSFMPWLLTTAFLHSVVIQERRDMLRVWNVLLITGAFLLTIFGTFITRSGIISSVHSFGFSDIGHFFAAFLVLLTVGSFGFIFFRIPRLRSAGKLDSVFSKESSFLLNNLLFLGVAFAVFVGTVWPIITEALRDTKVTVGAPFFNFVVPPLGLALLVLTGLCPILSWRVTGFTLFLKNLFPMFAVFVVALVALLIYGISLYPALFIASSFALMFGIAVEFYVGAKAQSEMTGKNFPTALADITRRSRRRYGGYIVHFGIAVAFVGLTASSVFQTEEEAVLKPGEAMSIGAYTLVYKGLDAETTPAKETVTATLDVSRKNSPIVRMKPSVEFYPHWEQPSTEVAIYSAPTNDLYAILVSWADGGDTATFRIFVNPFVSWIWFGALIMTIGVAVALLPRPKKGEKQ